MSRIRYYKANISDLESILYLSQQTFLDAYLEKTDPQEMNLYLSENINRAKISSALASDKVVFYIVELEGNQIGYLKLRWDRESVGNLGKALELERIYLLKSYYNLGYGQQMLDYCLFFAKEQGFETIWLLVWNQNLRAIRFYCRNDFAIFALKDFTFGNVVIADFLMKRNIVA